MPKKSTAARGGAQRNRPKVQRNIELVRPTTPTTVADEQTRETQDEVDPSPVTSSADTLAAPDDLSAPVAKSGSTGSVRTRSATKVRENATRPATTAAQKDEASVADTAGKEDEAARTTETSEVAEVAAPRSAATRLAARRQAAQKNLQRTAVTLISAENYAYVRKDLLFIAILALIMFAVIIILHFVPGIGF